VDKIADHAYAAMPFWLCTTINSSRITGNSSTVAQWHDNIWREIEDRTEEQQ
jgi:hypothetical protein